MKTKHSSFLKLVAFLLIVSSLLCLASCGNKKGENGTDTSTTIADFDLVSTATSSYFDYYNQDLTPYITISTEDYRGLSISLDATMEDVDTYINDVLLPNYRTPIKVTDRAIANGDTVYIYYTGYIDDVAFDGGSNADDTESYPLVIGSGSFIPGFETGLVGLVPNTTSKENTYDVIATFPSDYGVESLNGKSATFKVWCEGILDGYSIPEFTAEFITETLGYETKETDSDSIVAEFKNVLLDEIREDIVSNLETEKRDAILEQLRESVVFVSLPDGEVDTNEESFKDNIEYYYEYYNYMSSMYYGTSYFESLDDAGCWYFGLGAGADWKQYAKDEAVRLVKNMLLMSQIAKLEGITVTEEEAKDWVRNVATSNSIEPSEVLAVYTVDYIYASVAREKAQSVLIAYQTFDFGDLDLTTTTEE